MARQGDPRSTYAYTTKRRAWLKRQAMVCHWCTVTVSDSLPMGHPRKAEVDHLAEVDQAPGVALDERLWVVSCHTCNAIRGARYWHDRHGDDTVGAGEASRDW